VDILKVSSVEEVWLRLHRDVIRRHRLKLGEQNILLGWNIGISTEYRKDCSHYIIFEDDSCVLPLEVLEN
jgi:hypothetical protein